MKKLSIKQTTITIDGKQYNSLEEVPEELKQAFLQKNGKSLEETLKEAQPQRKVVHRSLSFAFPGLKMILIEFALLFIVGTLMYFAFFYV